MRTKTSANTRIIDYIGITQAKITNTEVDTDHSHKINTHIQIKILDETRFKDLRTQDIDVLILPRISPLTSIESLLTSDNTFERALGVVLQHIERRSIDGEDEAPF